MDQAEKSASPVDALVIGGGPAGAAAALALRRARRSVRVVEREVFPRFHVGESLLPQSARLFERLGIQTRIDAIDFTDKWGATFVDGWSGERVVYDFAQFGGVAEKALQVDRARFDAALLDAVRTAGGVVERGSVRAVTFAADGTGANAVVEVVDAGGGASRCAARWVIDASGRSGVVSRALGLRRPDPDLSKAALYTHFRGIPRPAGRRAGDICIVSAPDGGWMWLIPLPGNVTSVGVVLDLAAYGELGRGDPERMFAAARARFPATGSWFERAERIRDVHVESSFAYAAQRYCGPGYLLTGDAASFIDPVFSSGVHLAMLSGEEAGASVAAVLDGRRQHRVLARFERAQRRRYDFMRRFVRAFYTPGIRDLFFAPTAKLGLGRAVTSVLAGHFDPPFGVRARIALFHLLGRMQEHRGFVRRRHGRPAANNETGAGPALVAADRR